MAELSKEMQQAIDNYGDDIKTLKDFVTAVRKRPGMYIGHVGTKGFKNMQREIFQNAIDQILDETSPGSFFTFFYDERTLETRVTDNGKGLPFDDIIRILTTNHTSKNFEKKLGEFSSGLHGSGAKIVNALSTVFVVESYRYDGKAVKIEFNKGYPTTKNLVNIPNKEKYQGTSIYFIPDPEIMGDINLEWKSIYSLIKQIISLTPLGSYCDFTAIDINGKKFTEKIINKDGIITDLIMKTNRPINRPIVFSANDGYRKLDVAFCYDSGDEITGADTNANITSFANFCPTLGGTHVDGCLEGICRWFTTYMNNIYLANQKKKDKLKITYNDIKSGLNIMISAAHLDPIMVGQSKELLSNDDMIGFCKDVILKGLDEWSKSNPQDLAKLAKFFKDMAEIRISTEVSKAKVATKYQKNPISDLPAKYKRPLGNKDIELIIVEGDSALGTVELARDRNTQGLFPIRGKISNAFKMSRAKFFENEEVQAITRIILGSDYKKGFTLDDVKVSKVIFMADADVDGFHIAALLERMFVMYFPQMITAGMVYKAVPPLYATKEGKKNKFFTEQIDITKYIQKVFLSKNTFCDLNKKPVESKNITIFFLRNVEYIYFLEKSADTYSINYNFLELVLFSYVQNKGFDFKKLKKLITSHYRFMDVYNENGTIVIRGTIEMSNLIICDERFVNDCRNIIDIIKENDSFYYLINGKKMSIYDIMKLYDASTPSNIQRFKGLGEMDEDELAESTLYPGSDRTLIRYTIDDLKETLNIIREYESNTKKILEDIGIVTRDDLLD